MCKQLPPCDCLNYCGDDPWIAQGKAQACEHKIKRDKEAAQRGERSAQQAARLTELRKLIERVKNAAQWSKAKCSCGHPACTDNYFLSFTRSDGRMCEHEADFIILAREYFETLFKENI